jgi:hypothetical protein
LGEGTAAEEDRMGSCCVVPLLERRFLPWLLTIWVCFLGWKTVKAGAAGPMGGKHCPPM